MNIKHDFQKNAVREAVFETSGYGDFDVDFFLHFLWESGYTVVPVTVIGTARWDPAELRAYQIGIMSERSKAREQATGITEALSD